MRTFRVLHLFGGLGGGSLGFQAARFGWRGMEARFETMGMVDVDPLACAAYEQLTGEPATCWDLFSREQWIAFHSKPPSKKHPNGVLVEPPAGWREITPQDMLKRFGARAPDVIFLSAPCKGFSGLLPTEASLSPKYQALNRLAERAVMLVTSAWPRQIPVILSENVPRMKQRGQDVIEHIRGILGAESIAIHSADHCAGELGGLAQRRARFLLIGRNTKLVKPFIYQPPRMALKSVGDVLGQIPLPDDPDCGPMHRLQRLQLITWLRLALIRAGKDWRDLQGIEQVALEHDPRGGVLYVVPWDGQARTITTDLSPTNGAALVSDPRFEAGVQLRANAYRIVRWDGPAHTVTGHQGGAPVSGAPCVADPRLHEASPKFNHAYKVTEWDQAAGTVAGGTGPSCGAPVVSDPRLGCEPRNGSYKVLPWDEPALTITASGDVHAGSCAIADPRLDIRLDERPDPPPQFYSWNGERFRWERHYPMTTLQLAALQGLPVRRDDGSWLVLPGKSDAAWREMIGNAVPPPAAQAIAEEIGLTLLMNAAGSSFRLSSTDPWVRRDGADIPCEINK